MGKKAVYNNKMLAIYISGEDFEELLGNGYIAVSAFIGKDETEMGQLMVDLSDVTQNFLKHAFTLERDAIDAVRDKFEKR